MSTGTDQRHCCHRLDTRHHCTTMLMYFTMFILIWIFCDAAFVWATLLWEQWIICFNFHVLHFLSAIMIFCYHVCQVNENDIPFLQLSISSCAVCFLSLASLTQRSSHAWITQKKFNEEEWAGDFNPRCLLYSTLMLLITVQHHLNRAPSCRDNSSVVRSCWEHGCFTSTHWSQSLAPNASPVCPHTQLLSVSLLVAWIQGWNYKWTE